mgnify:CR=1 FL=1
MQWAFARHDHRCTLSLAYGCARRYGLYVAEALHARLLPLQFIGFASTWDQVVESARGSMAVVGVDYDYDRLWVWLKVAAGANGSVAGRLPPAYVGALAEANDVVVVQPDDNWVPSGCTPSYCADVISDVYTPAGKAAPRVFVHSSLRGAGGLAGRLYAEAKASGRLSAPTTAEIANIKQWECERRRLRFLGEGRGKGKGMGEGAAKRGGAR